MRIIKTCKYTNYFVFNLFPAIVISKDTDDSYIIAFKLFHFHFGVRIK